MNEFDQFLKQLTF